MKKISQIVSPILMLVLCTNCTKITADVINEKASITANAELPENPLVMTPISFSINPMISQVSTLFCNEISIHHLDKNDSLLYPKGAIFYQVTWSQEADPWWFGAKIPNSIIKVERLQFNGADLPDYKVYTGNPLKRITQQSIDKNSRIKFILSQNRLKMP